MTYQLILYSVALIESYMYIMLRDLLTQKCVQTILVSDFGYPRKHQIENRSNRICLFGFLESTSFGVSIFTREYTQCTAGYTFCFVVVGGPLIKLASIWALQLIKHY
jgi:hypothetical protein